jgi:putative DNA primase/helicase
MPDYRRFFDPNIGLRAKTAAAAVMAALPLRWGPDGRFWGYRDGVWGDAEGAMHRQITQILDERYRPSHKQAIRDVLRGMAEPIGVRATPGLINFRNGMVRWNEHEIARLKHHDMYESTVQLPIDYIEDAECPEFDKFLAAAVNPDDITRVWQLIGYAMMTGNPLQRMFLLTGPGGNGKGVFLHVLTSLLGVHNVSHVPLHGFINDRWAPAQLFNRLANICGDIDTTYIEQTGRIKELAGEDMIPGERKHENPFDFEFWGKAIFSANGIPASADATVGWSRRWEVIGFPNAPKRPDRRLKDRLCTPESLHGIAARGVRALVGLLAAGEFDHGESAARAHLEFRQRSNTVLRWLEEDMFGDAATWYDRKLLLKRFRLWAHEDSGGGARPMGSQTFYDRLRAVPGMVESKRQGVWGFRGMRFRAEIAYGQVIDGSTDSDEEMPPEGQGQNDPDPIPGL